MIKDRLQSESTSSANAVRIAQVERQLADTVREREFNQFMSEVMRRLDSIENRVGDYREIRQGSTARK
jgi:hypothetical protein